MDTQLESILKQVTHESTVKGRLASFIGLLANQLDDGRSEPAGATPDRIKTLATELRKSQSAVINAVTVGTHEAAA